MRKKIIFTLSFLIIGSCLLTGQTSSMSPSPSDNRATAEKVSQLEEKIRTLEESLEKLEKQYLETCSEVNTFNNTVSTIKEDKRFQIERYHDHTVLILSLIGLLITVVVAVVGLGVPYFFNKHLEEKIKKHEDELEMAKNSLKKIQDMKEELIKVIHDHESKLQSHNNEIVEAKQSLEEMKKLKEEFDKLKQQITDDKQKAENAANQAKLSEIISQAYAEKDPKKAIELWTKVLESDPNNKMAFFERAYLKDDVKDYQGAVNDLNKAIDLDPYDADAYINRGAAKYNLGDTEEAIKDYDKAISLNPEDAEAYNNRAYSYFGLGEYDTALKDANTAINFNSGNPNIFDTRGEILMAMGRLEEADNDFTKVLYLDSNFADGYIHRASCLRKLAESETDNSKKAALQKRAEADEARYEKLTKK